MKKKTNKTKSKARLKRLYIDIYDIEIFYLISDWPECAKTLRTKFGYNAPDKRDGTGFALPIIRSKDNREAYFIWMHKDANDTVKIHECFHAAKYILSNYCSLDLTDASEEAYAYLLAFICQKVMNIKIKK